MKRVLSILSLALLISSCGTNQLDVKNNNEEALTIKQTLSSVVVTPYGSYMDFSYTTNPDYVKYDTPNLTISFANQSLDSDDYFTTSIDPAAKTFRITCIDEFDSVATATLSFTGGVSSSITLNCREKVTGISAAANWWVYLDEQAASTTGFSLIDGLNRRISTNYGGGGPVFSVSYSNKYTVAKEAGYTYSNALITGIYAVPLSGFATTWDNILEVPASSDSYYYTYANLIEPALSNVQLNDRSIYTKLKNVWNSLAAYDQYRINQYINGDGRLSICIDKSKLSNFNAFVDFQNVSYENNFSFNMGQYVGSGTCGIYIPW